MNNVTDISMIRLVEQGKKDPNRITDSLIAAGYHKVFTPDELVIATVAATEVFAELELPDHLKITTVKDVSDFVLNEIVDGCLQAEGYTAGKLVAEVIKAGFTQGAPHE